jgi:biotin carboxyl carrier protein
MTRATLELDGVAYEVACVRKGDGWTVTVDGHEVPVALERNGHGLRIDAGGRVVHVELAAGKARIDGKARAWKVTSVSQAGDDGGDAAAHGARVRPPMNGKLERILVKPGQDVAKGDVLFILEAMKMQNEVRSPVAGRVSAVHGQAGAVVEPSHVVVEIGPS